MVENAKRTRRPLPDFISKAPTYDDDLKFYWRAFWRLSSCRSLGFGMGPIPISDIFAYCRQFKLDHEDTADFVYMVQKMDETFLDFHRKQAEKDKPKK